MIYSQEFSLFCLNSKKKLIIKISGLVNKTLYSIKSDISMFKPMKWYNVVQILVDACIAK